MANAPQIRRWIRVVLIIAAVLASAIAWSGLSLRDVLSSLVR
jgi:hypothetical protein